MMSESQESGPDATPRDQGQRSQRKRGAANNSQAVSPRPSKAMKVDVTQAWKRYEYQCIKHYMETAGAAAEVWHWDDVPYDELFRAGWLPDFMSIRLCKRVPEYGLDGLAKHGDSYVGIQCKERKTTCGSDLGTFQVAVAMLRDKNPGSGGVVMYSGGLDRWLKASAPALESTENVRLERLLYAPPAQETPVDDTSGEAKAALYPHQRDAVERLREGWEGLGILQMPCGTGKTVVFATVAQRYQTVVVLSPLRIHAKQTLDRMAAFLPGHEHILVDMDGTRDAKKIKRSLGRSGKGTLISATFKSVDVLANLKGLRKDAGTLVVVDESHNLSDSEETRDFLDAFRRVLLVSATPVATFDGEDIQTLYRMPLRTAIDGGYVTDYRVVLPLVRDGDTDELKELEGLDEFFKPRLQFLATGMMRYGLRKCIIYTTSVKKCKQIVETAERIFQEHYGVDFLGACITEGTKPSERDRALRAFARHPRSGVAILASVRILNEGVDVPPCDSIFIAEVPDRTTDSVSRRAVQRLCRAVRKDPDVPFKVAHAFVWAETDDAIPEFLSLLKEADPECHLRVKKASVAYDGGEQHVAEEEAATLELGKYVVDCVVVDADRWRERLEVLKAFVEEHKRLPTLKEKHEGVKIGRWVSKQRHFKRKGTLREDRVALLDAVPHWAWDAYGWRERLAGLKAFVEEHKRLPTQEEAHAGVKIGDWVHHQRRRWRKGTLPGDRAALLEAVPHWTWDIFDDAWRERLEVLKAFVEEHKRVPTTSEEHAGAKIGIWAKKQRQNRRKGTLPGDRAALLEAVPHWTWGTRAV